LIEDHLPSADLILCRDCLVHLSYDDIRNALKNICSSNIRYLLTTTFPNRENRDIETGQWRPLNLEAHPFFLPKPIAVINENCSESKGAYSDKSLALWDLSETRNMWLKSANRSMDAGDQSHSVVARIEA